MPDAIWPGRAGMNRQSDRVLRSEEPEVWWSAVYRDAPITTQWDDGAYTGPGKGASPTSSNSMPTMVFSMLDALSVEPGQTVLEIGTGTGWNAALLSHRLGAENVVTVEVDEVGAEEARTRLNLADFRPLVHVGDGAQGYPERAPYDRLIATCSIGSVPPAWRAQVKPGGVIVTPWGPTYGGEGVARLTVADDGSASGPFVGSSAFMRMRAQRKSLPPTCAYLDGGEWPGTGVRSATHTGCGSWTRASRPGRQRTTRRDVRRTQLFSPEPGGCGMSWSWRGAGGPTRAAPGSTASGSPWTTTAKRFGWTPQTLRSRSDSAREAAPFSLSAGRGFRLSW